MGSFWHGEFQVPCSDSQSLDTFLKFPNGWRKGLVFLNNKNLGKYWPRIGPQMTLYVPGVWLNPPCQKNTIVIFEQEKPGCDKNNNCFITLTDHHIINGPTPKSETVQLKFRRHF